MFQCVSWTKSALANAWATFGSKVNRSREALGNSPIVAERLPGFINIPPQVSFEIRRRIGCNHIKSAGQVISGPACADDSCADDGYVFNLHF
jgi:hypothetical protein